MISAFVAELAGVPFRPLPGPIEIRQMKGGGTFTAAPLGTKLHLNRQAISGLRSTPLDEVLSLLIICREHQELIGGAINEPVVARRTAGQDIHIAIVGNIRVQSVWIQSVR
jgi:hypothetical protein